MPADIPFWAVLAFIGASGGMFRYLLSDEMRKVQVVCHVGLGAILGPAVTMMVESGASGQVAIGHPAQCLLSLCVGGTSVLLFDRFSKSVAIGGDKFATHAENKFGGKPGNDPPAEGKS